MAHKPIKKVYFCDGALQGKIPKILSKHYELIYTQKDPDYVFYSVMGEEHINYKGIRIFSCGENVRADFNFCDYAIGFDYMLFEDRYLRYPLYLHNEEEMAKASNKHRNINAKTLKSKTRFCTFVVSNGKADEKRAQFFAFLSKYKKVHSGGAYQNNIGKRVKDKLAFLQEGKFNIAFENSSTNGYTTEKLIQALGAQTIPIYWGDTQVSKPLESNGGGINPRAFINCHNYESFEEILKVIQYLNENEQAYLDMLSQPSFLDDTHEVYFDNKLEEFLLNIFNQPIELAYRRGFGQWRCNLEKRYCKFQKTRKISNAIANSFKKVFKPFKLCYQWLK